MMDLVVPVLGRVASIYLAGQLFTAATFALIVSGRARAPPSSLRALVGAAAGVHPLLYNHVFLVGVMNYVFGIGLALWALAAWVALREGTWPLRFAVSAACVVALFFCHLFAVGIYGIGVLAWELWRAWCRREKPLVHCLAGFAASGLPFLAVLPLLLSSPTLQLAGVTEWEPPARSTDCASSSRPTPIFLPCCSQASSRPRRAGPPPQPAARPSFAWVLLAVGGLVYLAMPRVLFASYLADQRLPIALAFAFFAGIDVKLHHRLVGRGFIAILLTLVAVRLIEVDVSGRASATPRRVPLLRQASEARRQGARRLRRAHEQRRLRPRTGARRLLGDDRALRAGIDRVHGGRQAHPRRAAGVPRSRGHPRRHAAVDRGADAGGRPGASQRPDAYWRLWSTRFDYLYVLFTDPDDANPDPRHLDLIQSGDRFQLYRIEPERDHGHDERQASSASRHLRMP